MTIPAMKMAGNAVERPLQCTRCQYSHKDWTQINCNLNNVRLNFFPVLPFCFQNELEQVIIFFLLMFYYYFVNNKGIALSF